MRSAASNRVTLCPRRLASAAAARPPAPAPITAILREVWKRSGDKPFDRIEDVIPVAELAAISEAYRRAAGFERESLARRGSLV